MSIRRVIPLRRVAPLVYLRRENAKWYEFAIDDGLDVVDVDVFGVKVFVIVNMYLWWCCLSQCRPDDLSIHRVPPLVNRLPDFRVYSPNRAIRRSTDWCEEGGCGMVGYGEYVCYIRVFRDDNWTLSKNAECDRMSTVFVSKVDDLA